MADTSIPGAPLLDLSHLSRNPVPFALFGYSCASRDGWRGGTGAKTTYRNRSNRLGLDQGCADGSAGG